MNRAWIVNDNSNFQPDGDHDMIVATRRVSSSNDQVFLSFRFDHQPDDIETDYHTSQP